MQIVQGHLSSGILQSSLYLIINGTWATPWAVKITNKWQFYSHYTNGSLPKWKTSQNLFKYNCVYWTKWYQTLIKSQLKFSVFFGTNDELLKFTL